MDMGIIGLGRMGANMTQRLVRGGHRIIGFDPKPEARKSIEDNGAESAPTLAALVGKLQAPRTLWMMVPSGKITDGTVADLLTLLSSGDTIVDGGNSNYKDTLSRAKLGADKSIHYVDCGTSGGVWGLAEGYSMMIGGDDAVVERLRPIFETLAPGKDKGWGHVGPVGSGHFTKMVHNGIEYGLMQAYAEGFSASTCIRSARSGATAAWCARGCWTSPPMRWERTRPSMESHPLSQIPEKDAGR